MDRSAYLDFAELQARTRKPMYMADWIRKLDDFIRLTDREILTHAGQISHDATVAKAEAELAKFREAQAALPQPVDRHFEQTLGELEKIEGESKSLPEPKAAEAKSRGGGRSRRRKGAAMGSKTAVESHGFRKLTLGEFVRLQRGHDLPTRARRAGSIPVMGSAGINGFHDEAVSKGPGVTIGRSGDSMGVVNYSQVDYWPHNTTLFVTDFLGNDPRFAYYLLQTIDFRRYNSGSAQASLNRNNIYSIEMMVPDPAQQKVIAHIFGTLDDKIELNRRMNETLEAMARAVFRSWFVDFDPVRAKAEGRKPDGLDAATAKLFPYKFEESPLGPVPKGWRTASLLEQAELLSGGTPDTNESGYWDGGIRWASAKDVSQCGEVFLVDTERSITNAGLENSSTKMIPAWSTVVVARGATTGRLTMFGEDMAMNQTCYALRSRLGTSIALYCQLREAMESLVNTAHGSVFDTITTRTFQTVQQLLPPGAALTAFEERVRPLFAQILNNIRQSCSLAALRDALLPKLLSGEVQVGAAVQEVA